MFGAIRTTCGMCGTDNDFVIVNEPKVGDTWNCSKCGVVLIEKTEPTKK